MRIHVRGRVDRARMLSLADDIATFLREHDIEEWCGLNIYLTPLETGTNEHVEIVGDDGMEIEAVTIANPNAVKRKRLRRSAQVLRLVKS